MRSIPFARPIIGKDEQSAMHDVLAGVVLTHGPKCKEFEEAFASFVGTKYAVSTSNCTTAIHLGLVASGVGPGDEVIVPAMTHVATAHAVEHCGAIPIFTDVDQNTGCINPDCILEKLSPRTKAIIVVHFVGLPADMASIRAIARNEGITVIEDSATALGATYNGVRAGALADLGCFSFYPSKHITSLEGGMLTTNDERIASQVRSQRAFGYDRGLSQREIPGVYNIKSLGWNYRMSEGHAAVGAVQLARVDDFLRARKRNAEKLASFLSQLENIKVHPFAHGDSLSAYYCVNIMIQPNSGMDRNDVAQKLKKCGIGTSVHYPVALPLSNYYSSKYPARTNDYQNARRIASQTISLPCGPHLDHDDVDWMGETITSILS